MRGLLLAAIALGLEHGNVLRAAVALILKKVLDYGVPACWEAITSLPKFRTYSS